ncbi:MAG: amidohydrolase family protein, partial [Thermoplasmata archaeon]
MKTSNVARLALLAFYLLLTPGISRAEVTAILAARVVDPETGATLHDQTILVEDSRVVAIGSDVQVPAEARVLAIPDLTLLPGYFDCHAHVAAWLIRPQRAIYTTWIHSTAYRVLRGSVYAREMLEAGFTTIRNLSEAGNYGDTALAQAIDEGVIPGPKMIPAGLFVVPSGAEAPPNPEKPDLNWPDKVEADTLDELRKVIRRNIHFGARVIKVLVDDTPYIYSAEELEFMVAEAGAAGVKVAAHAVTDRGARAAAEARVGSIEHGTDMSEETRALVKKNGVIVVPTPFTPFLIRQMGIRLSGMKNSDDFADADKVHEKYVGALKQNYDSG